MKRVEFQPIGALLKDYIEEVRLSESFKKIEISGIEKITKENL